MIDFADVLLGALLVFDGVTITVLLLVVLGVVKPAPRVPRSPKPGPRAWLQAIEGVRVPEKKGEIDSADVCTCERRTR